VYYSSVCLFENYIKWFALLILWWRIVYSVICLTKCIHAASNKLVIHSKFSLFLKLHIISEQKTDNCVYSLLYNPAGISPYTACNCCNVLKIVCSTCKWYKAKFQPLCTANIYYMLLLFLYNESVQEHRSIYDHYDTEKTVAYDFCTCTLVSIYWNQGLVHNSAKTLHKNLICVQYSLQN
jgi:hypothetical protein